MSPTSPTASGTSAAATDAERPAGASGHGPAVTIPPRRRRRFRSLASRLVALGVVQLVLLAFTAAVIFIAEGPHEEADPEDKLTPAAIAKLEHLIDAPVALNDALDALRADRVEISLYDETHQLIASNVDPPLAIPPRPMRRGHRPPFDGADRGGADHGGADHGGADRGGADRGGADRGGPDHGGPDRTGNTAGSASPEARPEPPADLGPGPNLAAGHDLGPAPGPGATASSNPGPAPGPGAAASPSAGPWSGPLPPEMAARALRRMMLARHYLVVPIHVHGGRGVLVARGVHGDPPGLTGPLVALSCGFLILVIGALITARWIVRPIERLSRTARALGSGDLKARSQLDRPDEIGELGHRFDEMADRIAGLLASEKELLANVAHELRTPLTRIGVALDLANEGDAEAARASLAEIAVDVSELETIVDDILTAMRFELASGRGAAQLPLRRVTLPAAEIATAAADRMRGRHPERPLEVACDDAPAIHVDPVLFRRVIDNLLENAHKYTPDPDAPIRLELHHAAGDVVFEVSDRGMGIPSHDLPQIFTAFFRGERSRSRETGGVGLGLTLARRIVEAHGGAIDVTSAPNVGTTVRVTLPA